MRFETLKLCCDSQWQRIRHHDFVEAIGRGQLTHSRFCYFVEQDAVYLRDFSRVLARLAVKAPDSSTARILLRHADTVFEVEQNLHQSLGERLGMEPGRLGAGAAGAVTKAYQDHLVRTADHGGFPAGIAAVLPCYWTYRAIGIELAGASLPKDPLLTDWIMTYAGDPYGKSVQEMIQIWEAEVLTPDQQEEAIAAYHWSMVYERLFWEQAWRLGVWE